MGGRRRGELRRRPVQQRSAATVGFILDAAAQLFAEQGYLATTTNAIADRAGVSIGSLYQYFANKDELLSALAQRHLHHAGAELRTVLADLRTRTSTVEVVVDRLVAAVGALNYRDPALTRLLWQEAPRTPALRTQLRTVHDELVVELAWHLAQTDPDTAKHRLRAEIIVSAVMHLVHTVALPHGGDSDTDAVLAEIIRLARRYLEPPSPSAVMDARSPR